MGEYGNEISHDSNCQAISFLHSNWIEDSRRGKNLRKINNRKAVAGILFRESVSPIHAKSAMVMVNFDDKLRTEITIL